MFRTLSLCACCRHYPGQRLCAILSLIHPAEFSLTRLAVSSACALSFSRCYCQTWARRRHSRLKLLADGDPMSEINDLSRSLTSSGAIQDDDCGHRVRDPAGRCRHYPGIERHPLKKLEPSDEELVRLWMRWRTEAIQILQLDHAQNCRRVRGRSCYGFWLARWLRARGIETYGIHLNERSRIARASPRENRSARRWIAQTRLHRLVASRTRSLSHGSDSNARGGACEAPEP